MQRTEFLVYERYQTFGHITSPYMDDGLRKQAGESDHLGINQLLLHVFRQLRLRQAWNPQKLYEVGTAIGEEALQEKVAVIGWNKYETFTAVRQKL